MATVPSLSILAFIWLVLSQATPGPSIQTSHEEPVQVTTPDGALHGTLTVPPPSGKAPVVLIIAGSGPTDRDGNSRALPGKNNAYSMLAQSLATEGVASLRYDKRGVGESRLPAGTSEADMRFEMGVDDAVAWVTRLRTDARFSAVILAGHSEGSLIGMLAAGKTTVNGFLSIAGVAHRASDVLRAQLRPQIGAMPALWSGAETILASLEAGTVVDPLPPAIQAVPALASLFRLSVQPYLISWTKYLPSAEIARLPVPVLILQGTTDIQVSVDEAQALKAARPDAELVVIDGMNHVMKSAPADRVQNIATYSNPDLPIVPDVSRRIAEFAKRVVH